MSSHKIHASLLRKLTVGVLSIGGLGIGLGGLAGASTAPAQATKGLLKLADFPKGWTSTPASSNHSTFPGAAELASCIGVPKSVLTSNPPTAYSPDFSNADGTLLIDDTVAAFASASAAQADFNSLANSKTPACLATALNSPAIKKQLTGGTQAGTTYGTITVSRVPASAYASGQADFDSTIPVTTKGVTVNLHLIEVVYVKGNLEQSLEITTEGVSVPTPLSQSISKTALSRI